MTIAKLARPEIQALKPYEAAAQIEDTIRLNANEAPWTSSTDNFRRPLNRYPELRPAQLRATLAARYGCAESQLLVTRGNSCFLPSWPGQPALNDANVLDVQALREGARRRDTRIGNVS